MIAGNSVRPNKWSDVLDLFDDGVNSYIFGYYEDLYDYCIGVRWNGNKNNIGYPNHGNNPLWFVLPKHLWKATVGTLKALIEKNSNFGNLTNINIAIERLELHC